MNSRGWLASLLLSAALLGCGIGASVTSECAMEQDAYRAAQRKRDGFLQRGISRQDVTYRAANEGVLRAQAALRACEGAAG
jgi:hypothetical protein